MSKRPTITHATTSMSFLVLMLLLLVAAALSTCTPALAKPTFVRLPADAAWRKTFLEILHSQMGLQERTGRNDGPHIDRYLRSAGLGPGYPYCYALPYWAADSAARVTKTTNPLPRTASTQMAFDRALKSGTPAARFGVGSIAIYRVPRRYEGHAMTITKILGGGWVLTYEGNTSSGRRAATTHGERDGQGNYSRRRCLLAPLGRMYLRGIIVV